MTFYTTPLISQIAWQHLSHTRIYDVCTFIRRGSGYQHRRVPSNMAARGWLFFMLLVFCFSFGHGKKKVTKEVLNSKYSFILILNKSFENWNFIWTARCYQCCLTGKIDFSLSGYLSSLEYIQLTLFFNLVPSFVNFFGNSSVRRS